MAVKIRLKRFGKKHAPFYRVVVMDSHTKRDGRAIEEIGKYHPTEEPSVIVIDSARALYWLRVGAQPSEQVVALLKLTGDWQAFKGEKGATNTVQPQVAKASPEDRIKEAAKAAERQKAAKAAEREKAAKAKAEEEAAMAKAAKAAAAEAAATEAATAEAAATVEPETTADESHEVPTDEGSEVEVEIAEGDPSDAGDKVEGIIDEAKVEG
jgi:small subunit ribosomal protein S16